MPYAARSEPATVDLTNADRNAKLIAIIPAGDVGSAATRTTRHFYCHYGYWSSRNGVIRRCIDCFCSVCGVPFAARTTRQAELLHNAVQSGKPAVDSDIGRLAVGSCTCTCLYLGVLRLTWLCLNNVFCHTCEVLR